jgi:hypothetical protein
MAGDFNARVGRKPVKVYKWRSDNKSKWLVIEVVRSVTRELIIPSSDFVIFVNIRGFKEVEKQ